jgi:energy-coupling factor transport system ATP-binding protein
MQLRLVDVGFRYPSGTEALAGIDLTIEPGEALGIIGANGSGKSTLARLLVGLLRPTDGKVMLDGSDIAAQTVAQTAAVVGLAFQDPDRQIFGRSVRSEVEFGPRNLGHPAAARDDAVEHALATLGLEDVADAHPQDLGESRRKLLSIASILAMRTPIVMLDEPTTGLDASGRARVEATVSELRAVGRSVLVISHDMRFIAESVERVVLLEAGRIGLDAGLIEAFAEHHWTRLRAAGVAPPAAAIVGARLGLGSTPTERRLLEAAAFRAAG